ncbi:MAG TPA: hypothetical protein VKD71_11530 [Gemmataceae bacterium]|nr:hypothetical protein [Gemmataceae bacterium]
MGIKSGLKEFITNPHKIIEVAHLITVAGEIFSHAAIAGAAGAFVGFVAWAAGVHEIFVGLRKETHKEAFKEEFRIGYSIGVVAGAFGKSAQWVKDNFWMTRWGGSEIAMARDKGLADAARNGHNIGLMLGSKQASEVSESDKQQLRSRLKQLVYDEGTEKHDPGNDVDRTIMMAGAFMRAAFED